MRKRFVLTSVFGSALIAAVCGRRQETPPEPVSVEVQKARPAEDRQDLAYSGTIEESESIPHSFSIVGTVTRVLVSEGTPVRKGQLLGVPFDDGLVDPVPSSSHRQHVRALIEPHHSAAVSIVQRLGNHSGPRRDI